MEQNDLRKLTLTAIFIAIGVLLAPFSIPLGAAKAFPVQHMINVLLAIMLGWRYSLTGAFCISSIRIAMLHGTAVEIFDQFDTLDQSYTFPEYMEACIRIVLYGIKKNGGKSTNDEYK